MKNAEINAKTKISVTFFGIRLVLINGFIETIDFDQISVGIQRLWGWV